MWDPKYILYIYCRILFVSKQIVLGFTLQSHLDIYSSAFNRRFTYTAASVGVIIRHILFTFDSFLPTFIDAHMNSWFKAKLIIHIFLVALRQIFAQSIIISGTFKTGVGGRLLLSALRHIYRDARKLFLDFVCIFNNILCICVKRFNLAIHKNTPNYTIEKTFRRRDAQPIASDFFRLSYRLSVRRLSFDVNWISLIGLVLGLCRS